MQQLKSSSLCAETKAFLYFDEAFSAVDQEFQSDVASLQTTTREFEKLLHLNSHT